jgi:four helix bundle protein
MQQKILQLKDITAYKKSFHLSNDIWNLVSSWDYLAKDTVGKQFIRAVDSISANIAEGYGRYHKKDKQRFYFNARGSTYEALDWLQKAKTRKILVEEEYKRVYSLLSELPKEINTLISWTQDRLQK